jgi:AcrR family transcriptional regulator
MEIENKSEKPRKKTGRPLSFDREVALERAMLVFWRYGYEAASLSELTSAMGITPPSLYAAFGDKEKLFLEAVERYSSKSCDALQCLFNQAPTARDAIERLLQSSAIDNTCPSHPPGCLVVTAATNCSASAEHVQSAMTERRDNIEGLITTRIEKGIAKGELHPDTDAGALASFYMTVIQGMSTQARDSGGNRDKLLAIAATAMRAWPIYKSATN